MEEQPGTVVITGCNGGLGSSIVRQIVSTDLATKYHAIYTVRNVEKATSLNQILTGAPTDHKFENMALDLSSLQNVRQVARAINERVGTGSLPPIRAIILNAGYQEHNEQLFSKDGFDMSFQVNYLSHWLLTLLLLQSMDKEHGRVVIVGSSMHDPSDPRNSVMDFYKGDEWKEIFPGAEALAKGTWSSADQYPTTLGGMRRYGAGKLCLVMFFHTLQKRLDKTPGLSNISVVGVDPGAMPSGLGRRGGRLLKFVMAVVLPIVVQITTAISPNGGYRTTQKSAKDVLRAAFDTKSVGEHPKNIYFNGDEIFTTSAESRDERKQDDLWKESVKRTGIEPGDTVLHLE